ncbi:MAG: hypothetical protein FWH19_04590 [Treponema sp.]|nr:hypothetical protein [Treponema sp.]
MKYLYFLAVFVFTVFLPGCDGGPFSSEYQPVLPALPAQWSEILGEAHWRLEWIGEEGSWQELELAPGQDPPAISLMGEWSIPVLAWPFWPAWSLFPGMMRPAGGLFPWDCSGARLELSWEAGVQALFWKELAMAAAAAEERQAGSLPGRLPWHFDWPRLRGIIEGGELPGEVQEDLWLADWREIARRTIASGFDRRRIVARRRSELLIPELGGYWAGSSPFAAPLEAEPEGPLRLMVSDAAETWVSRDGVLRCSAEGWVFAARD